jgi:hypothetical protein
VRAAIAAADIGQHGSLAAAANRGVAAAGREGAARDRLPQRWHDARYLLQALGSRTCPSPSNRVEESARIGMRRPIEQLQNRRLLYLAACFFAKELLGS